MPDRGVQDGRDQQPGRVHNQQGTGAGGTRSGISVHTRPTASQPGAAQGSGVFR